MKEGAITLCSGVTDLNGHWTCTSPLALGDGLHTVTAMAIDGAGNMSPNASRRFTIDLSAVSTPSFLSPAANSMISDTTPTFIGLADPLITVTVKSDAVTLCTVQTDNNGNWQCTTRITLTEGLYTITAVATNEGGIVSTHATLTFTIDFTAPVMPVMTTPVANSVTVDSTPIISGTAEPTSTVTVKEGGVTLCSGQANAAGNWVCTPSIPLDAGLHTLTATATDAASNVSLATSQSFTIESSMLSTPTILSPAASSMISDTLPTFVGIADPATTVTIKEGETLLCNAVTNASGQWHCTANLPLSNGVHTITAVAMLSNGATSAAAVQSFSLDATPQ